MFSSHLCNFGAILVRHPRLSLSRIAGSGAGNRPAPLASMVAESAGVEAVMHDGAFHAIEFIPFFECALRCSAMCAV